MKGTHSFMSTNDLVWVTLSQLYWKHWGNCKVYFKASAQNRCLQNRFAKLMIGYTPMPEVEDWWGHSLLREWPVFAKEPLGVAWGSWPTPTCGKLISGFSWHIASGRTSKYGGGTMYWVENTITGHKRQLCTFATDGKSVLQQKHILGLTTCSLQEHQAQHPWKNDGVGRGWWSSRLGPYSSWPTGFRRDRRIVIFSPWVHVNFCLSSSPNSFLSRWRLWTAGCWQRSTSWAVGGWICQGSSTGWIPRGRVKGCSADDCQQGFLPAFRKRVLKLVEFLDKFSSCQDMPLVAKILCFNIFSADAIFESILKELKLEAKKPQDVLFTLGPLLISGWWRKSRGSRAALKSRVRSFRSCMGQVLLMALVKSYLYGLRQHHITHAVWA